MRRRQVLGAMAGVVAGTAVAGRARTAEPFQPLGMVTIAGTKEVVVDHDGETAYIATTDGFATVDLADPEDPTRLAERRDLLSDREGGPMETIWDVKLDGDRLVVAGPANPPGDVRGFLLYDVSDPADPRRVAFYETPYPIHNAFIADDVVYLTAGGPIVIVDVSDDNPRQVARWSIEDADEAWTDVPGFLRPSHDLWVQDGLAYVACWDAGTWIVDVSDPAAPEGVGRVGGLSPGDLADLSPEEASREATEPPGNHHYVQPSADDSLLAVGKESWSTEEGSGGPSGIDLWDVSDPSSPARLAEIAPPAAADETRGGTWTTSHNFDIVGDRLYSSWYQGGVKVHDIGDPEAPEELAWWRRPEEAAFWAASFAKEEFFVASSTSYPAPEAADALYTFPNRSGEQPDPPSLTVTPDGTNAQTRIESNGTRTATESRTVGTDHGSNLTTDRDDGSSSPVGSGDQPTTDQLAAETPGQGGFGLGTAVSGLGIGLVVQWAARTDPSADDE